jgi:hypothetical protein
LTDFLAKAPTLDANWCAVVLFGRNVASYKFALAKTLLGLADRPGDRVTLEELAAPFARHLCEHLRLVDRQTTSRSSKFLDACRAFDRGELPEGALVGTTARLGFSNVIDAFHVVGSGPVPVRFFEDERSGSRGGGGAVRLTDDLRRLSASMVVDFPLPGGWLGRIHQPAQMFLRRDALGDIETVNERFGPDSRRVAYEVMAGFVAWGRANPAAYATLRAAARLRVSGLPHLGHLRLRLGGGAAPHGGADLAGGGG